MKILKSLFSRKKEKPEPEKKQDFKLTDDQRFTLELIQAVIDDIMIRCPYDDIKEKHFNNRMKQRS